MSRANASFPATFELCARCQAALQDGQELCPSCGQPTKFMSFKARAQYEVEQWKRHKAQAPQASNS